MRPLIFAVLAMLVLVPAWSQAPEPRLLLREAFDGTGSPPARASEHTRIRELPPSIKALQVRPPEKQTVTVFQPARTLPAGLAPVTDYELRLRFLFPNTSTKAFTLQLVHGDAADPKKQASTSIAIAEKSIAVRPPGVPPLSPATLSTPEHNARFWATNLWQDLRVRVSGGMLTVWVTDQGAARLVVQVPLPVQPFVACNLSTATAVDFDDLELWRLPTPTSDWLAGADGWQTAQRLATHELAVPAGTTVLRTALRLGSYPATMQLKLRHEDGLERVIDLSTSASSASRAVWRTVNELNAEGKLTPVGKQLTETVPLPDTSVLLKERQRKVGEAYWQLNYFVRPRLEYRYTPEQTQAYLANWDRLPAASETPVNLVLHLDGEGVALWLGGRYATRLTHPARLQSIALVCPPGAAYQTPELSTTPPDGRFLPLDISAKANPGALAAAKVSPTGAPAGPGPRTLAGVPLLVADGPGSADTGHCIEGMGSFALECDGYLSRGAFDGLPESFLFSVPVAQYHRAWVLCAVTDDADRVPVLTARLTRFLPNSMVGRGPAIADTEMTLPRPGEALPAGVTQVGELSVAGRRLPLLLVPLTLDSGAIQEVIYQEGSTYLDFELLGQRHQGDNYYFDRSRKPADTPSAVHVFGVTLERPAVAMLVEPGQFANLYQPGETPAMKVTLTPRTPTTGVLRWVLRDQAGQVREQGQHEFSGLAAPKEFTTPFAVRELGWYQVDYTLSEAAGEVLLRHQAYLALIAADTRQAGYDSPYFAWNYGGSHGTIKDLAVIGPLLLKAGIRQTHVASEEAGLPWKLGRSQIPRLRVTAKTPETIAAELEKQIKEAISKFPHASTALVFHESGGGPFPIELLGGKTEITEAQQAYDRGKAEHLALMAGAYRQHAPHIKLVVGNSGMSNPGLIAALMRGGAKREQIDYIGEESVGMTMPPELSVARENWINQETARFYGMPDLPLNACYEWKSRRSRHLGLARHAEWQVRDLLIGHAWHQTMIPMPILPDVATSYYNSVWGDGGFTHYPQTYPKPVYPAVANATQILDGAVFQRQLATGSNTVYALEFKRGTDWVTACWTARGETQATVSFDGDGPVLSTTLYGVAREATITGGQLSVTIGEGASYLSGPRQVRSVSVAMHRQYPREALPAGVSLTHKLDQAEAVRLVPGVDPRLEVPVRHPVENAAFRRAGKFAVRGVVDETQGPCLELELLAEGDCPAMLQEYTLLRLAQPVPVPGRPHTVGLKVKGNSSWGKIFWEVTDAEGEVWLSVGTGGYGCNAYDWPEQAGINFDGWHTLQFPLTGASPVKVHSPGQDGGQWQHNGAGNGRLDYPISLSGVAVSLPRQAFNLLGHQPAPLTIRLADLLAY